MSNLGPNAINTTYPGLLQVDGGVNDILKPVTDGLGNPTGLSLSSTGVSITGVVSANAQNIVGGTAGAVLYQAGVGSTGFVVPGTAGQFLQSNGTNAPTWTTFNAASIGALPLTGGTLVGPLSLSNNTISSVGNPVNAFDAANKSYVDSKASGLNIKESCVVATTVNITLSGTQTIDGVAVTSGQRVLIKNQSAQSQNGIYIVSASTWSRSSDAATWADLIGATVFITSGSTQAASTWTCSATAGGTIGVTAVVFVQFAASQSYTASGGITLTGNNFTLASPVPQSLGGTGTTVIGAGVVYSDGTSLFPASGSEIASCIGTATVVNSTNSTNSTYANNLTGGAVGDLLYQSASGVTSKLNISSAGFILTSTGTGPEWGLVAPYAARLQYGTAGSIPYQTGSSSTSFLPIGANNYVLSSNGTGPVWSPASSLGSSVFVDVTQAPYNVVSDNTGAYAAANTIAMQQAINDIKSTTSNFLTPHKILYVPSGYYCFNAKLVVDAWINIECHSICVWSWAFNTSNPTDVGLLIDYSANRSYSLSRIRLPAMQGPVGQSTGYPGYSAPGWSYNLTLRRGNAVEIRGGYWLDISANHISGFENAFLINGTSSTFACDNINVNANTIDLCEKGFNITGYANGITCVANTLFCKYPFYTDTSASSLINAVNMKCTGAAFVNEINGCAIYAVGTYLRNSSFYIEACKAGYQSDSTTYAGQSVPSNTVCAYLGGNQYPSGELGYGDVSQTTGYFGGNFCTINVGIVNDGDSASSPIPAAGNMIRVRNAGNNNIKILHNDYYAVPYDYSFISCTATRGEQYYNGGVGSAPHAKVVPCTTPSMSLAPGATITRWAYHQLINGGLPGTKMQSLIVSRVYNDPSDSYVVIKATVDGTNNREILIEFYNSSTTTTFNGFLNFFLIMPN